MESIINLYNNADIIDLIIFWGIVVVILLLILLIIIMAFKNYKTKQMKVKNDIHNDEEELPIKYDSSDNDIKSNNLKEKIIFEKEENIFVDDINNDTIIESKKLKNVEESTKNDSHVLNDKDINHVSENIEKNSEYYKSPIEIPTAPYQKNVLREMSLSQTSPIGINRKDSYKEKQIELVKDLSTSLNYDKNQEQNTEPTINIIKEQLTNVENKSVRNTKIINDLIKIEKEIDEIPTTIKEPERLSLPKELIELNEQIKKQKTNNEKYLEEVSQKLAEAEVTDEVERTNYELQQEEDAIISYTELMEKKDSIQTIEEEDAVISIEELMERENNKNNKKEENNSKLYNINENEENDDFIRELKQFRNDL